MKRFLLIFALSLFALNATAQSDTSTKKEFIEIAFLSNGNLMVDGKKSTQKALIPKLEALEQKKGEVHYYQAPKISQQNLMKNIALIKLFKKYKMPVIAYADKNFSKRKGE
jgi:hypothetical protein